LQPGNSRLGFRPVGHCDEAKAPRLARLPILGKMDALHDPTGLKQLANLVFGRRISQIAYNNVYRYVPLCSSIAVPLGLSIPGALRADSNQPPFQRAYGWGMVLLITR
jgi:hypothetical protein